MFWLIIEKFSKKQTLGIHFSHLPKNSFFLFSPLEWDAAQDFPEREVGPMSARQQGIGDLRRQNCAL